MKEKIFSPGQIAEDSGLYPVIGPEGDQKGYMVTVVQGETFPKTPEKGWNFGTPHLAKTTALTKKLGGVYCPPALPNHRPVFRGNTGLVPSDNLPNGRPMLARTRQVASIDHLPLHRPIFHSDLKIAAMHGARPVFCLDAGLVPSSSLPENRPIAHQDSIIDPGLMGYID